MSLQHIFVVVCSGMSDIGKGWLTASIGAVSPQNCVPVKIDPLLNTQFPRHLGVEIATVCDPDDVTTFQTQRRGDDASYRVSDDMRTYKDAGLRVYPECNILGGDLFESFLAGGDKEVRPGEIKKLTFNDVSHHLCGRLAEIVRRRRPKTLLIEIGGTIEDAEHVYLPAALRFLPRYIGIAPEIVLLTYFEYAETDGVYRVKTQTIRRALASVSRLYHGLPMRACFVRRRTVPEHEPDEVLLRDLDQVAYETQVERSKLILLPNVQAEERSRLTTIIAQSGLFSDVISRLQGNERFLISACLLGIRCQYDGQPARRQLDARIAERFGDRLIPVCPEQLGGLSTPREPVEIRGGDGRDVLHGTALVVDASGADHTDALLHGSREVLKIASRCGAARFIGQTRSPSCSCGGIYDGTFQHRLTENTLGVCSALLDQESIELISVADFEASVEDVAAPISSS